jgi:hypothetical protein
MLYFRIFFLNFGGMDERKYQYLFEIKTYAVKFYLKLQACATVEVKTANI